MKRVLLLVAFILAPTVAAAEERCVDVPVDHVSALAEGFNEPVELIDAQAVRSRDRKNISFISARMVGGPGDGLVATCAKTGDIDGPGLFMGIPPEATKFAVWPNGQKTKLAFEFGEDGYAESRDCVLNR
jgi:hypothetical protein